MGKILTLGESLLRLTTPEGYKFADASNMEIHAGGAEANVAINLAKLDHQVKYATKLPQNNGFTEKIRNELQGNGIDCSAVLYGRGRLGTYYLELGTGLRASNILYDRNYSAISLMEAIEWDLDELFEDVSVFHLTGVTLALSKKWFQMGKELIQEAKKRNIKISFDMNYRQTMWSYKDAKETYQKILPLVNYLSAGKLDAIHFMDIPEKKEENWEYYIENIAHQYPNIEYIFGTNRHAITPNSYDMDGYIWDVKENKGIVSVPYKNYTVVDRVGTGDSYMAGILDGIILNRPLEETVNFAMAASALKHTVYGDINPFNRNEIESFMNNTANVLR